MTIITESSISECQSQRTISISDIINTSLQEVKVEICNYNLDYNIENKDVRKFIKNKLIKNICLFKKNINVERPVFYINKQKLKITKDEFLIAEEVTNILEMFASEKSKGFYRNFLRYLERNGLLFLKNEFFKQVSNKLALFK